MTALRKYARLEASGLWRSDAETQRRDVIVSIGDATLVISDTSDRPLTHWSLAAIERKESSIPAIYFPGGATDETLELPESESEMIAAIETLRKAVDRARPKPGRLRWLGALVSISAVAAVAVLWVPGALLDHALRVVPTVKRSEIGDALLSRITRVSGPACEDPSAVNGLSKLASRTGVQQVVIVPEGIATSLYLPGGTVLLNKAVVEDFEDPDVAAGYVLAETVRSNENSVLRNVLDAGGIRATASLLTTGRIPEHVLDRYAETAPFAERIQVDDTSLLSAFETALVHSTPYAYAQDVSGESTLALIEADPMAGKDPVPIMRDAEWLGLQAICEGW